MYCIFITFIVLACSKSEDNNNSSTDKDKDKQNNTYVIALRTSTETLATQLTDDEKRISSIFVAIYDELNRLIDHKIVSAVNAPDLSSSLSVSFTTPHDVVATKAYIIANILSNNDYQYFYDDGTKLSLIDFSGKGTDNNTSEDLKKYFAEFNHNNRVVLRHAADNNRTLTSSQKTPLPMLGEAIISSVGTTTVPMQMAVARIDIVCVELLSTIDGISATNLTNTVVATKSGISAQQTAPGDYKLSESIEASPQSIYTYYIPSSFNDKTVDFVISYKDNQNSPMQHRESLSRLLGGHHYTINVDRTDNVSTNVASLSFGPGIESLDINIDANVDWEIVPTTQKFSFSQMSGSAGKATVRVTTSINTTTTPIIDEVTIRKKGNTQVSTIVSLTQKGVDYLFTPNDLSFMFDAAASEKTLTIDRATGITETSINSNINWLTVSKTTAGQRDTYTIKASANGSTDRNAELDVRNQTSRIRQLSIAQRSNEQIPNIVLKINGVQVGNTLSTNAMASKLPLDFKQDPSNYNDYKLRYASETNGQWCRLWVDTSADNNDIIYHDRYLSFFVVDENIGPERSVDLELYDVTRPLFAHKRFTLTQAASQSYCTLSAPSLTLDLWGNVYFKPYTLSVKSNINWSLEQPYADWIKVTYKPGMNSDISISVKKNETGAPRNTTLKLVNAGTTIKEFKITQGTNEDPTFDLKYRMTLDLRTTNNEFRQTNPINQDVLYVIRIEIFDNNRPSNVDRTSKFTDSSLYGYVVDAPASFNRILARDLSHEYFYIKNYRGQPMSVGDNDTSLSGHNFYTFFRQLRYSLPVPAGVKQDEIVLFNVEINNMLYEGSYKYDTPIITHRIEKQIITE